jgi:hypothetical protein
VVLLAGLLEPVDDAAVTRVGADAVLKKPFEASAVVALIRPLVEAAQAAREARVDTPEPAPPVIEKAPEPLVELKAAPETVAEPVPAAPVDPERVRAAVTVALDRAMPAMIDEITERVLVALGQ